MRIWVDADACPKVIKEILYRAAQRLKIELILVANSLLRTPSSRYIRTLQVSAGFDVADREIEQRLSPGDLVITADIPLASAAIGRGAYALNPRGELYTAANIGERLGMRNVMEQLRSSGVIIDGPATLNQADRQAFANQLDCFLTRYGPGASRS